MTLNELGFLYNFHDSIISTPLKQINNDIYVAFSLDNFWQSNNFKEKYKDIISNTDYDIFIYLKFNNCSQIKGIKETFLNKKGSSKRKKITSTKTEVPITDITDNNIDNPQFIEALIPYKDNIFYAVFVNDFGKNHISFCCDNVEVIKEEVVKINSKTYLDFYEGNLKF